MKQQDKLGQKNKTGAVGEMVAAQFLKQKGFVIIDRNYLKKWGEIDVIAKKYSNIHFIEVKTVSYQTKSDLEFATAGGSWRPEENVHRKKLLRMGRTVETWLLENNWEGKWQIDVAAVRIVPSEKYATIKVIENVIIE